MVKNRQLSTVPLNFDCSRVWQWMVNSTAVAFGSESAKQLVGENEIDYHLSAQN